jgi:hypothetical protein
MRHDVIDHGSCRHDAAGEAKLAQGMLSQLQAA